ncbi:hypothetical protein [Nostoc sp. 'Peltigera membranacea cyanobiont' 210A]|uniref:hypothetical protein n=1 Tax=Nostoc sp. 'Peltigera membranacea cyanobiont' 210A TaxID=2014529 RepID=UPI00167C8045|nr:hypothetical protein [Nostoc sp. 'Peltigera membranacea cyanobiont' 210A]
MSYWSDEWRIAGKYWREDSLLFEKLRPSVLLNQIQEMEREKPAVGERLQMLGVLKS